MNQISYQHLSLEELLGNCYLYGGNLLMVYELENNSSIEWQQFYEGEYISTIYQLLKLLSPCLGEETYYYPITRCQVCFTPFKSYSSYNLALCPIHMQIVQDLWSQIET